MSENAVVSHPTHQPMTIKNLPPRLAERGKIKLGMKGKIIKSRQGNEFQPPMKLDHFRITTLERDGDGNLIRDEELHALLGDKPTQIPIRLLYDDPDLNFQSQYACYIGKKLWCRGDGEAASRLADDGKRFGVACTCERAQPDYKGKDRCKMNGRLSVIIEGAARIGSVWTLRTTSFNSIQNITWALRLIRRITGGPLANIKLWLTVRPQVGTAPDGQSQTIYVASIEYRGTEDELQRVGLAIALEREKAHLRIEHIEEEARRLLLPAPENAPLPGDDPDEVVEEFYPEQVQAAVEGEVIPPKPTRAAIAAEIKQESEEDPLEVVNSQGEIILSTTDEKVWGAKLDQIMAAASKAGASEALDTIVENNAKTLGDLTDKDLQSDLKDSISLYCHEVAMNGSKQVRRAGR